MPARLGADADEAASTARRGRRASHCDGQVTDDSHQPHQPGRGRSRSAAASAGALVESGQKITVACTLILALAALGVGWWYWSLRKEAGKLKDDITAAEQETRRLRTLIVQVRQFEERKAQLQQRVTLIETAAPRPERPGARAGRHQPERAGDAVADPARPEGAGPARSRAGALTLTSISDFVDNLGRSGWFTRPVEIVEQPGRTRIGGGRRADPVHDQGPGGFACGLGARVRGSIADVNSPRYER